MKEKVIEKLGRIIAAVTNPTIAEKAKNLKARIFTASIAPRFQKIGKNSIVFPSPYTLHGLDHITIGNNTTIGPHLQLTAWTRYQEQSFTPKIIIGNNCRIRSNAHITATNLIVIGDNLLTGTNVYISDNSHGNTENTTLHTPPEHRQLHTKGAVHIGKDVWLGNNVCVLSGVTIGNGAVIGANSVVTHDIPPYSVAAGIPARVIKPQECPPSQ